MVGRISTNEEGVRSHLLQQVEPSSEDLLHFTFCRFLAETIIVRRLVGRRCARFIELENGGDTIKDIWNGQNYLEMVQTEFMANRN